MKIKLTIETQPEGEEKHGGRMTTTSELLTAFAKEALSPGDPHLGFIEWFCANKGRWIEACRELDIEPPIEGPWLFRRIRATVLPVLADGQLTPAELDAISRWTCAGCSGEVTLENWQEYLDYLDC